MKSVASYGSHAALIGSEKTSPRYSYAHEIKLCSYMQLTGGFVLMVLGIVSICILGYWSYFATPIWSGILIFCLTGGVGLWTVYRADVEETWAKAFTGLSLVGAVMAGALVGMYIYCAVEEQGIYYGPNYYYVCQPGRPETKLYNCSKSEAARVTFDALIVVVGFYLIASCAASATYGFYSFLDYLPYDDISGKGKMTKNEVIIESSPDGSFRLLTAPGQVDEAPGTQRLRGVRVIVASVRAIHTTSA